MRFITVLLFSFATIFYMVLSDRENKFFDETRDHHTKYGFINPYLNIKDQNKKFSDLFRMMKSDRPNPIKQIIDFVDIDKVNQNIGARKKFVTWIGHSTMLLHVGGKTILTDPIFSDRCSPVQFIGPKRYTQPSIHIQSLPKIDIVLISHNHYDHLDKQTVRILSDDSSTIWFIPLGLEQWLRNENVKNIIEMDWLDEHSFENVEVVCLPSQHWSKRNLFKSFDTLWSSWSVTIDSFKFWFAGDTGYNEIQFKEIGNSYGPFDLSAIPIGAYEPRWFMKNFHVQPEESILIHRDVKSIKSIGMHFGTFVLTTEPIDDPPKKLNKILENDKSLIDNFIIPKHGVIYDL